MSVAQTLFCTQMISNSYVLCLDFSWAVPIRSTDTQIILHGGMKTARFPWVDLMTFANIYYIFNFSLGENVCKFHLFSIIPE